MPHRVWRCQHPAAVEAREAAIPKWFLREFERATDVENNAFWTTALIPHPADDWPAPATEANLEFEWIGDGGPGEDDRAEDGKPRLHGSVYVDGSCTTSIFFELRRAATPVM